MIFFPFEPSTCQSVLTLISKGGGGGWRKFVAEEAPKPKMDLSHGGRKKKEDDSVKANLAVTSESGS